MDAQEKVIEMVLDVGETVFIRRLSPLATQAFVDRAKTLHPSPIEKDYVRPLSDIAPNAVEGMMMSADQNPEYAKDMAKARAKQNEAVTSNVLHAGVVIDTPEGREATIARYADRMAQLGEMIDLPADEWLATVLYGLITTSNDKNRIFGAATGTLSGEELSAALRMFRQAVQRS